MVDKKYTHPNRTWQAIIYTYIHVNHLFTVISIFKIDNICWALQNVNAH